MDDKVTQVCIVVLNQHASYLIQLSSESCSFIWPTMNGRFQKISIPIPRTAFWISEGEGGFTITEFWGHGGVFTFGNPKAWGGFTGGISGVESVELVLCKRYCCGLLYFVNKPWTYDWESRRQTSIDQTRIYARNLYKWTVKRGFHTYLDKIISCHMNKIYKWILQLASCLLPCDKQ